MMLARLAFIMRAYKARVGPLETMSIIPIRSFFMMTKCFPLFNRGFNQFAPSCRNALDVEFTEGMRTNHCKTTLRTTAHAGETERRDSRKPPPRNRVMPADSENIRLNN